ncbi:potassium-transporting ATPase subunit F [Litorihabitans aurantiacus]|nr:potassium-transporting ATPase subunit F [Litorihabitans aurantiacus]
MIAFQAAALVLGLAALVFLLVALVKPERF